MNHILKGAEISRLLSEEGGGTTQETHLVQKEGKKYVLRRCKKVESADFYEALSKKLEKHGFLPKLLGREGKKLLYEYLPGRDLRKKDALKYALIVGKIIGKISNVSIKRKKIDFDKIFSKKANYLHNKSIIDKKTKDKILEKYKALRKKIIPKAGLEVADPVPDNFRLSRGKVYLVDIDAIRLDMEYRSFAKAFVSWFRTSKQRERFEQGYNSVSKKKSPSQNHLDLVFLYHLVNNISMKAKEKRVYSHHLKKLHKLVEGRLK